MTEVHPQEVLVTDIGFTAVLVEELISMGNPWTVEALNHLIILDLMLAVAESAAEALCIVERTLYFDKARLAVEIRALSTLV